MFFGCISFGYGQEIASFSSVQNSACSGIIYNDANLSATGICRGIGITENAGLTYNSNSWTTAAAIDSDDYLEWTITPNAGYQINLTSMDIRYDRSPTGPTMAEIQVDDGSGFVTVFSDGAVSEDPGEENDGIDLTAFTGLTGTITFRLFAYNAIGAAGTFDIEEHSIHLLNKGILIKGSVTNVCSLTTTWDGTTWDNGVPTSTANAVLDSSYSTSLDGGSFEACSLTVNDLDVALNPIVLNIDGTDYVAVENDITINGSIVLATEASLVQVNDASTVTLGATGDGVLQKSTEILTAWYDYTYWSSPVSNETIGSVFGMVPSNRIFEYDASNFNDADNDTFDDEGDDWSVATGIMTSGKGYAAVAENNPFPFPQTNTMSFNGQFNNGIITTPVTISPGPNPLNWNFLGNPYPSPINAITFVNDPANSSIIGGTLYFWTHNSPPDGANPGNDPQNFSIDDYASYVVGTGGIAAISGGVVPTEFVATGQGFFIEGLSAGVATFNNAMRTESGNTNFYRTRDKVWLNFTNEFGAFSQILIGFNEYATDGFDRLYDGKRLDTGSFVSFYSFIEDEKFAIQSKSELMEEEIIPLGFMTTIEGETMFSIALDNIEGLLEESEIYLIDYYLNKEHDLNASDYIFTTTNGSFADRFALKLKSELTDIDTSIENELVVTNNENGGLNFTTTHQSIISNIKIFDMLGRLMYNEDFDNEITTASFLSESLKNTILITNVTLADGKILTKKIIN